MALFLHDLRDPNIEQSIDAKITRRDIITWQRIPKLGYTHVTHDHQWEHLAYIAFSASDRLTIRYNDDAIRNAKKNRRLVYAVYHGRFIEMLLEHFSEDFTWVSAERYRE